MARDPHPGRDRLDGPAPDLTRSIMGRLGYMQVSRRVARRRRLRAAIGRAATITAALGLVALGLRLHESSPSARRPAGLTIPSAIRHDVGRTQEHVTRALRGLRDLITPPATSPPASVSEPEHHHQEVDEDVDRSAIGPMRWL